MLQRWFQVCSLCWFRSSFYSTKQCTIIGVLIVSLFLLSITAIQQSERKKKQKSDITTGILLLSLSITDKKKLKLKLKLMRKPVVHERKTRTIPYLDVCSALSSFVRRALSFESVSLTQTSYIFMWNMINDYSLNSNNINDLIVSLPQLIDLKIPLMTFKGLLKKQCH